MRVLSTVLCSAFLLAPLTIGTLQAGDYGYDEVERQQELLGVWYEVREANAERGDTQAMFDAGMANYVGRGTPVDHAAAAHWFQRAAGDDEPRSHYYLGYMYAVGEGVAVDPERSLEHYTRAAELGHAEAQYWIGSRFTGGAQRDDTAALQWLTRAAEQGVPEAQYSTGYFHEHGRATPRDAARAAEWYSKAAQQGHRSAQIGMGRLHQSGRGVPRDRVQAYVWFSRAGDEERIRSLQAQLTRRDLNTAETRLREEPGLRAAAAR